MSYRSCPRTHGSVGVLAADQALGLCWVMGRVITADFGNKSTSSGSSAGDTRTVFAAVHVFGEARGCRVSIIHDEEDPLGDVLKVVVGEIGSDEVEAVAIVPASREGKREAVTVGLAVLRTLEMLESLDSAPRD